MRNGYTLLSMTVFAGLLFATPAHACVLGWGSDCPITKSEADPLVKEKVDGTAAEQFIFSRKLTSMVGQNHEAMLAAVRERMNWITSDKPCAQMPSVPTGRGVTVADICERGRYLHRTGLFTMIIQPTRHIAGINYNIQFETNPKGGELMKGLVSNVDNNDFSPSYTLVTHIRRFLGVGDTRTQTSGGYTVAAAEFAYELVPNIWARVAAGKNLQDDMPVVQKTGTARFEKWSGGWRLVHVSFRQR